MTIVFALKAQHSPVLLIVHVVFSQYLAPFLLTQRVVLAVGRLVPKLTAVVTSDSLHLFRKHAHGWRLLQRVSIRPVLFVGEVREDL